MCLGTSGLCEAVVPSGVANVGEKRNVFENSTPGPQWSEAPYGSVNKTSILFPFCIKAHQMLERPLKELRPPGTKASSYARGYAACDRGPQVLKQGILGFRNAYELVAGRNAYQNSRHERAIVRCGSRCCVKE